MNPAYTPRKRDEMTDNGPDSEPQPAETIADIVAEMRERRIVPDDNEYDGDEVRAWADRIEAASRPDPDTITVYREDLELILDYTDGCAVHTATLGESKQACRAALAAAGLPQEPTAARPRPTLKEQRAHLDEGSCGCHDSWDQCPCAEGGHPADGSCNCCSLGTGLCGPLPQEPTEGGDQ